MRALIAAVTLVLAIGLQASAQTVPTGFRNATFVSSIPSGTAMAFAPDGRLFVCQQTGAVRVVKQGQLLAAPFTTVPVDSSGERGLLGIALDPAFASNKFVYIYYTTSGTPRRNRVSRFTAQGDVAASGSEVVILELDNLSGATNHNGGALAFGPDGALYVAVGDNANGSNSQTLSNRLGKILRINEDGTIPTDNPFFNVATGVNRAIWARGLRNPFTFAFEDGSGRMHINDVGAGTFEEINEGIPGANYGWPASEGPTSAPGHTGPIYWYGHSPTSTPNGCAITGGTFYRPTPGGFPASFSGDYFFADLCSGFIRVRDAATGVVSPFATGLLSPVDLDVGPDGALYYLARGNSIVGRISVGAVVQIAGFTPSPAPPFVLGTPVTWTTSLAPGAPPSVEYQFWQYSGATKQWTSAPYSPASTFVFNPAQPGTYALQVWARMVGSSQPYDAFRATGYFTVSGPTVGPLVLTLSPQVPASVGSSVTFTAGAQGGVAPHTFQFWLYRAGSWSIARPYDTAPTWVFTPTTAGVHAVQVWARSAGSSAPYDAFKSTGFFTVAPSPPSIPSTPTLTASPGLPVSAGTPVTWTGLSTGGAQPAQYKFWLYSQASNTWQITKDWSAANTWLWVPPQAGRYAVQVWVRGAGSTANYQAYTSSGYFTIAP